MLLLTLEVFEDKVGLSGHSQELRQPYKVLEVLEEEQVQEVRLVFLEVPQTVEEEEGVVERTLSVQVTEGLQRSEVEVEEVEVQ